MPEVRIITTSDGSHSLLNTALNETYHSVHGAIQESQHVFIRAGLEYWEKENPKREIRIFEMGFGTGLNAFLTLLHAQRSQLKTHYESWESFPLDHSTIQQLNYPMMLGSPELFSRIHLAPWEQFFPVAPWFDLRKTQGDLLLSQVKNTHGFNLVYYDAFAPSKQPEMWTQPMLSKVADVLLPGGVLVTYCAKGQVRRDLQSLGLAVENLPGPPGKRVMIRATKAGIS